MAEDLFLEMYQQLTPERIQEVTFAGLNGEVLEGLGVAEQWFYDEAVEEAKQNPGVVWSPVEF